MKDIIQKGKSACYNLLDGITSNLLTSITKYVIIKKGINVYGEMK